MKLILVSHEQDFDQELSLVADFMEHGLEYFHLRKPLSSEKEMRHYIEQLPREYYSRVVLHSHHHLAEEYDLRGGHFRLADLHGDAGVWYKQRSLSFHSLDEIRQCEKKFDYAFLSPVFDSISKPGYKAAFDHNELRKFLPGSGDRKLIALGGVDENNAAIACELGFSGVAVKGSIWESYFLSKSVKETEAKFKRIYSACRQSFQTY